MARAFSGLRLSLCSRVRTSSARAGMTSALAAAVVVLGGCQTTRTEYVERVVTVRPHVAPSLLRCKAEPEPLPAGARQRDIAPYVIDLAEAGADCRRKLGTVATQVQEPKP